MRARVARSPMRASASLSGLLLLLCLGGSATRAAAQGAGDCTAVFGAQAVEFQACNLTVGGSSALRAYWSLSADGRSVRTQLEGDVSGDDEYLSWGWNATQMVGATTAVVYHPAGGAAPPTVQQYFLAARSQDGVRPSSARPFLDVGLPARAERVGNVLRAQFTVPVDGPGSTPAIWARGTVAVAADGRLNYHGSDGRGGFFYELAVPADEEDEDGEQDDGNDAGSDGGNDNNGPSNESDGDNEDDDEESPNESFADEDTPTGTDDHGGDVSEEPDAEDAAPTSEPEVDETAEPVASASPSASAVGSAAASPSAAAPSASASASPAAPSSGAAAPSSAAPAASASASASPEPCIAAEHLAHFPAGRLVFARHRLARVLCDAAGSCATAAHVVVYNGAPMTMGAYCRADGVACTGARMLVNSPRMGRALRVASRTAGLEFTALAARYGTRLEETVLRGLVRLGL